MKVVCRRTASLVLRVLQAQRGCAHLKINTLWTGDAHLRLYITIVQDG